MAAGLHALSDQNVCSRSLGGFSLFGRPNLTHHQNACIEKTDDNLFGQVPEESDHWNPKFYARDKLLVEKPTIGSGRNEINPE
jgi:hypothetical protein